MSKEFKKLQKENNIIRNRLDEILIKSLDSDNYTDAYYYINELIENELKQEEEVFKHG